jgi:PleD family two-component response regulator
MASMGFRPAQEVNASFGVAARTGEEGLEPLMRRANEALYRAKRNGRDSVRLSDERPAYERSETVLVVEPLKAG